MLSKTTSTHRVPLFPQYLIFVFNDDDDDNNNNNNNTCPSLTGCAAQTWKLAILRLTGAI